MDKLKKLLVIGLCLALVFSLAACGSSGSGGSGGEDEYVMDEVTVSTVEELVNAVADDTIIYLEPGIYDITEYIDDNLGNAEYDDDENCYRLNDHIVFYEEFDGYGLGIEGISSMYIESVKGGYAAEEDSVYILVDPRYVDVLTFADCEYIIVDGVIMGHTPDLGSCEGSVVRIEDCQSVAVYNSELFGCGTYGFELDDSKEVFAYDCLIDDCSYGMTVANDSDVQFEKCSFCYCEDGYSMFELTGSDAVFMNCDFSQLYNNMLAMDEYSTATFSEDCTFDDDAYYSVSEWEGSGQLFWVSAEE